MRDFIQLERAQLGLQYIEDAVVGLLGNHPDGLPSANVADALGLRTDLDSNHRDMIADGVLALLQKTGRIVWDDAGQVFRGRTPRT